MLLFKQDLLWGLYVKLPVTILSTKLKWKVFNFLMEFLQVRVCWGSCIFNISFQLWLKPPRETWVELSSHIVPWRYPLIGYLGQSYDSVLSSETLRDTVSSRFEEERKISQPGWDVL